MRNIFLLILGLWFTSSHAQPPTIYKYYMYLTDYRNAHPLSWGGTYMAYSGSDVMVSTFYYPYTILTYYQAFPDAIDSDVKNIYYIETYDSTFAADLIAAYPGIYVSFEDVSDVQIEFLAYYPDDYGTTSPITNLGAAASRQDLDYIHAPDAWDITKGSSKIKIGISDSPLDISLPDFYGKVTVLSGSSTTTSASHGTNVAAFAAEAGDNSSGTVGVCMDCEIISGSSGTDYSAGVIGQLYQMAQLGAKVINFSWTNSGYVNEEHGFINAEQMVINDLVLNFKVALVAAAGNQPSFGINDPDNNYYSYAYPGQYGELFVYPATYDNVISVSSVQYKNAWTIPLYTSNPAYCCYNSLNGFELYGDIEDTAIRDVNGADPDNPIAIIRNGYYQSPTNIDGFQQFNHTLNSKVDLLAPGRALFSYSHFGFDSSIVYGNGTSYASPMVAGTIGLMLSVNDCLLPSESEAILKLTARDIEHMPVNTTFTEFMGAGKLEVGDAVNFVNEMTMTTGNAVIDNHIFTRFNFKLDKINNNLTLENVVFEQDAVAEFTAKNQIEILPETDLNPDTDGHVDLQINGDIDITCAPVSFPRPTATNTQAEILKTSVVLSPNPNQGHFGLYNLTAKLFNSKTIEIQVNDINGRILLNNMIEEKDFEGYQVNMENLSSGLYIVKLFSPSHTEQIKFIKQ